jgi:GAF domain-containing protein
MNYRRPQKGTPERREGSKAAGELAKLAEVASSSALDTIWKAMVTVKEVLDMDVAVVSKFIEDQMVFYALEGDAESFGWREGQGLPFDNTFCKRMIEGRLTHVVQDAKNDERVNDLDVTWDADVGSYVGLPLRFSDGQIYGTLFCVSHSTDPSLPERHAEFMSVLARLIAEQLEREERR